MTEFHKEIAAILYYLGFREQAQDEDFIDAVLLTWLKAQSKFNPKKSKLSTFKFNCIRNAAIHELKFRGRKFRTMVKTGLQFPEPLTDHDFDSKIRRNELKPLIRRIKYFINHLKPSDLNVRKQVNRLKLQRNIEIYKQVKLDGLRQHQVRKQYHITKTRVQQIVDMIHKVVVKKFDNEVTAIL